MSRVSDGWLVAFIGLCFVCNLVALAVWPQPSTVAAVIVVGLIFGWALTKVARL